MLRYRFLGWIYRLWLHMTEKSVMWTALFLWALMFVVSEKILEPIVGSMAKWTLIVALAVLSLPGLVYLTLRIKKPVASGTIATFTLRSYFDKDHGSKKALRVSNRWQSLVWPKEIVASSTVVQWCEKNPFCAVALENWRGEIIGMFALWGICSPMFEQLKTGAADVTGIRQEHILPLDETLEASELYFTIIMTRWGIHHDITSRYDGDKSEEFVAVVSAIEAYMEKMYAGRFPKTIYGVPYDRSIARLLRGHFEEVQGYVHPRQTDGDRPKLYKRRFNSLDDFKAFVGLFNRGGPVQVEVALELPGPRQALSA